MSIEVRADTDKNLSPLSAWGLDEAFGDDRLRALLVSLPRLNGDERRHDEHGLEDDDGSQLLDFSHQYR